jgi:hypothetical protein
MSSDSEDRDAGRETLNFDLFIVVLGVFGA